MDAIKTLQDKYKIVPLSEELIDGAIALIETVFPYKPDQKTAKWSFRNSLTQAKQNQQYWLAANSHEEIVGVTGLYHYDNDKSVVWLGWFGVHPQHRRHGLGSMLLDFSISEASKRGFSVLKLYSSFDENEKAAHCLYRKYGFIQTSADEKADRIYFLIKLR
ncbi:MAG: GNAT family N-acetyltransferase [Nitrospiraceae bacterium]|nr:GNAT family N-acetyltransferase [Nitrospiraceae bacterium]